MNESLGPVHFAPVAWPNEPANPADCGLTCGEWKPYSRFQNALNDPRVRDPSNGGTSPQNYVNVSSSCIDTRFPSIYYNLRRGAALDGSQDVILFRWRVEQIANTYATGPNPGNYGATDPWNSALWTVFFDIDGDGYRDLAAHLNGSSGSPSAPVDMIAGIWGNIPTQSIDYLNDPNIRLIAHNPTAFVSGSRILNFQNSLNPSTDWGSAPRTVWDYGTTRSRLISTNACNEYFIDYQIPVRMLDASPTGPNPALNGPKITRSTPISMMFCSANSLNNPTQKDCAVNNRYESSTPVTGPFGDYLSFDQESPYSQPIISRVTATAPNTCPGPYRLSARVQDTLALQNGTVVSSVKAVDFHYWFDANGNGRADEAGGRWTRITPSASLQAGSLNTWNANWDATGLPRGAYLVGVQAVDDRNRIDLDMSPAPRDNRTFSYATGNAQGQVYIDGAWVSPAVQAGFPLHQPVQNPLSSEDWYGNPEVTGQQIAIVDVAINACGEAPSLSKTASPSSIATGALTTFTVALANTTSSPITLGQLQDALPPGFQFENTQSLTNDGSALVPTTQPSAGATGTVAWTFPDVSVLAGRSVVLSFQARAGPTAGTYTNTARAVTSSGTLDSPPATVGVDAARLSLSKTPDRYAVNPDGSTVVEYTLRWSNDSAVGLTAASIVDPLPAGTTYVGCSGGNSCTFSAPNVSWQLGNPAAGASGEVRLRLTVNTAYASATLLNSASISATAPGGGSVAATASSTIAVNVPRPAFSLEKSSPTVQVAPSGSLTWTLSYRNFGTGNASAVVLTDDLPDGFSFVSCSVAGSTHFSPCSHANGVVTFNATSVPAGASGSVSITASVAPAPFPFANPATNEASITWSGNATPVLATDTVGVTGQACSAVYYLQAGASFATSTLSTVPPPASRTGTNVGLWTSQTAVFTGPVLTAPVELANRILSVRIFIDPAANRTVSVTVERISSGGSASPIATFNQALGNSPQVFTFNTAAFAAGTAPLAVGERLRLTFGANGNNSQLVRLFYDGTQSFNAASTYTDSLTSICSASSPAALEVSKRVDKDNVLSLPTSLQYTIDVSNPGGVNATGALLTDTLPAGVNLVSVLLNGATVSPTPTVTAQQFSLPVNSPGQASGVIAAGGLGTVVVNTTATAAASGTLTNTASLSASGLGPMVDTASTVVGVPGSGTPAALSLSKTVSPSLLAAGDTATFRLTVVNTGGSATSGVVVTDDFPDQPWFSYLDCTAPAGTSCSQTPTGTLQWSLGSLAAGASASLEFRMRVASTGVPAGANALQNVATVADASYCSSPAVSGCTSNTVNLTISGQPRLQLTKSASPTGPYRAGDLITYSLILRNTGASDASAVQVLDPLPAYTGFAGGITASLGSGSFDAVDNRVVYTLPTLAAGAQATLSFQARVVFPLPQGDTPISNTATASAANAAPVQSTVPGVVTGAPLLVLDKQGPASVPYPAATLSSAANGSSVVVDSAQRLSVGSHVRIGSSVRRVTAIAGRTVSLDGSVTAAAGAPVAASIEYALVYANDGDADASSVVLSDTLPANLVYAGASRTPSSAPPVGSAGALSFSLGTLAAGESGQLQISAIPLAAGSYANSAALSAAGVPSVNDSVSTQAGGLVVDKRTTTPVRSAGQQAEYVLSVRNTSPGTLAGIGVTDPLPSGFIYHSTVHVRINGIDVVPLSSPTAGSGFPSWSSFSVPGGQTLEIRFLATVGPDVGPATYDNPLEVTAPGAAVTPFDPLATPAEDVTVLAPDQGRVFGVIYADIDANGSFDAAVDTPLPGAEVLVRAANGVVYIAHADYEGRYQRVVPAGNTLVSVAAASLPSGLVPTVGDDGENPTTVLVPAGGSAQDDNGFVPASGPVGNVIGRVFDDPNENGVQNPGEASRLGVRVELRDPVGGAILFVSYTDLLGDYSFVNVPVGSYVVRVERPSGTALGAATPNDRPVNVSDGGSARADFGLIVALTIDADLAVTKSNAASSVTAGASTTWIIVISNAGPSAANGATVFDPAAAGLAKTAVVCSGSSGGASCPPSPSVAALEAGTLAVPTLPAGASVTLQVTATVTAAPGDTVVNTVSVSPPDGVTDPDPANNSASDSDPVDPPSLPALTISKSANPSPFTVGVAASYTLQVSNDGNAATSAAVTISDEVPSSLTLGTVPPGCSASGQTVSCVIPSLAAGASSSFVIPVTPTAAAAPSVENTASVSGGGDPACPGAPRCTSSVLTPVNAPGLAFDKSASLGDSNSNGSADAGEVIAYTLVAQNTGGATLTAVSISDPRLPSLGCTPAQPATLLPGASLSCTGSYTVTQADIDAQVAISNTATASGTPPSGPALTSTDTATVPVTAAAPVLGFSKTASLGDSNSNGTADAGEVIAYTLTATNSGNVSLSGVNIVDPRLPSLSCTPAQPSTLAPSASLVCIGSYTVTLLDIKNGAAIVNTATADSDQTAPVSASATVPVTGASAALTLDKSAALVDTNANNTADVGELINYTLTATNTGNVSLTSVSISDPRLPSLGCTPAQPTTLLPGASLSCTGSYTVTQADIDAQVAISNTATASGTPPSGPALTSTDTATVPVTAAAPVLGFSKAASLGDSNSNGTADAGEVIAYTLTATNSGNVSLSGVNIVDPRLPSLSCTPAQPSTLAPSASLVCTGSYTVTLLDIKNGAAIVNTATADSDQTAPVSASATVPVTGASAALTLDKSAALVDTNANNTADVGELINYTLIARNTGNVSLTSVSISDPRLPSLGCTPAQPTTLLPGASLSCTGSYTVTQADIDAQVAISNTATASGTPPTGAPLTATDTALVPVTGAPAALAFSKTAALGDANSNGTADTGEVIVYTLVAQNSGGVSLTSVSISDPRLPSLSCTPAQPAALLPGASLSCTGSYTVTQADINAQVVISNTATASGTPPSGPALTSTDTATVPVTAAAPVLGFSKAASLGDSNSNGTADAGEVIAYTLTATNSGNVSLSGVNIVDPRLPSLSCTPAQPSTLAPSASLVCTGSYTVTLLDIKNGAAIVNTATADSDQTAPVSASATVPVTGASAALTLDKSAALVDTNANNTADVGELINYTLTATNTGNVSLTAVSISDPRLPSLGCTPAQPTTLLPGASLSCTGSYTVTQADIDAQVAISNTATASGTPPTGAPLTATDTALVPVTGAPAALAFSKTAALGDANSNGTADTGEVIVYTLVAQNSGGVSLTSVSISDPRLPSLSCTPAQPAALLPGASLTCTGTYTVTQADYAAQQPVLNTATATAQPPSGAPITRTGSASVPVTAAPPVIGVSKRLVSVGSASPFQIDYRIRVRNYGLVPLSSVQVVENLRQTFPLPVNVEVVSVNAGGGLVPNPGFNGLSQTELLSPGGSLAVGAEATIDLRIRVTLGGASGTFHNTVIASGSGPDGRSSSDDSVDGNSPDPDGNGLPDEQSPTPVDLRAPRLVAQIPVDNPLALLMLMLAIGFASRRALRRAG